jgi:predicted nucleotidyltransferase component of viral defense system
LVREMKRFDAPAAQVLRDHAISHALAALAADPKLADNLLFFGGTALGRTYLPSGRLSEDIDLMALSSRKPVVARIVQVIERGMLRSHGRITWTGPFTTSDVEPAVARLSGSVTIRIQVLACESYEPWPHHWVDLEQRYSDAPPARLQVPTSESFAASKTAAWFDRRAPRDLWDLWALAEKRLITRAGAELFARHGPIRWPPQPFMFDRAPSEQDWRRQLAHQTQLTVTADHALQVVRDAWAEAARPGSPSEFW